MFFQSVEIKISSKKFLGSKKLAILYHGHMPLVVSPVKQFLEHIMKKSCKRLTRKNSGLKSKQKKDSEALSNGRAMIVGLIQKIYYKDESIFS